MNKIILLTIICAISHKAAWAQTASVEIREVTGGLDMSVNGLKPSITTDADEVLVADQTTNVNIEATCSDPCTGTGAKFTLVGEGSSTAGVVTITCTDPGTGYKAGDVITLVNDGATSDADKFGSATNAGGNIVITLSAADISVGGLVGTSNALKSSITTDADKILIADQTTNVDVEASCSDPCFGTGAKFTLEGHGSTTNGVVNIICTSAGSGYKAGDVITLTNKLAGSDAGKFVTTTTDGGNIQITLSASDINGYVKVTPSTGFYRNSVGGAFNSDGDFDKNLLKGYYVALGKATNFISVKINYGTETMVPSVNGVSDTVLGDEALSALLPVEDGLNVLTLASSKDGTFVMNLIKPDDEIKVIQRSKRSMEIAYNPAAVGEFTCSAFTDASGLPTTRDNVKTGSGVIAKSVRTHNILPENIFNSIQVTLNGLTPSTTYDIHCFHLSHGIISNTAALGTDLASLTGVSLVPDTKVKGAYATLTLTFTHEKALAANAEISLTLYSDYNQQAIVAGTGTTCGDKVTTHTSNGAEIIGAHTCAVTSNVLKVVLVGNGSPVASTSTGSQVILVLEDDADGTLNLLPNPSEGIVITFDLEVTGHGKLLQQDGWTTTAS